MTGGNRLRAELQSLEEAAPADLPSMRPAPYSPRWRRLALPAAVMVIAGTLIGLSVPTWLPGAPPVGSRVGELVPVPTTAPPPSGMPQLCMQAYMEGRLVRHTEHGLAVEHGGHVTPVRWPYGYVAREGTDGLELLDAGGNVIAREGDFVEMAGGQGGEMWIACPGLDVIPLEFTGRLEGDAEMEGGCIWLQTDSGRRWPVIWPDGYREEFRDGQAVLMRNNEVVAETGAEVTVRGAPGGAGYPCIGFISYLASDVVAIGSAEPDSPSPEPPASRTNVPRALMSFVLPSGWTYRLPDWQSWGPSAPVIYFANQPMHDACVREETESGTSTTCFLPVDELKSDDVLIEWWASSEYWNQTPRPLPSGAPYQIGGADAVRNDANPEEACGLRATEAEKITVRASPRGWDYLTICSLDLTAATRQGLDDLLESIMFDDASVAPAN